MYIYGFLKGLWYGIFHSISAFCNAGFDIIGENSFADFTNDYYINFILIILIILGGIGFLVIEDLLKVWRNKSIRSLNLQSKIVLITTGILLITSISLIKILEPNLSILQCIFTAVTLRTAGFSTINMASCTHATKMIGIILMFIGGAPGSTSGGIRIIVFSVLILSIVSTLKNRKEVVVFYRKINERTIMKSITITGVSLLAIFASVVIMTFFNDIGLENIIFHCVGAFSDTGLGIISSSVLNNIGKLTIMFLMFIGRVGPFTAFKVFFDTSTTQENIKYVDGELLL